jgi:hypothetical protein
MKNKIFNKKIIPLMILIFTICTGIGYAAVFSTSLDFLGTAVAGVGSGVSPPSPPPSVPSA